MMAEPGFHGRAWGWVERFARRTQNIIDDCRNSRIGRSRTIRGASAALKQHPFLATLFALTIRPGYAAAWTLSLDQTLNSSITDSPLQIKDWMNRPPWRRMRAAWLVFLRWLELV
jgi:hypothetical protein